MDPQQPGVFTSLVVVGQADKARHQHASQKQPAWMQVFDKQAGAFCFHFQARKLDELSP